MRCLAALTVALTACGPAAELPAGSSRRPPPLVLDATALHGGGRLVAVVRGAAPGDRVVLLASDDGLGVSCPPELAPTCLDLAGTPFVVGAADADASGEARIEQRLPARLAGRTLHLQAALPLASPPAVTGVLQRVVTADPVRHETSIYDDLTAAGWQIETWPCASAGTPTVDLRSAAIVAAGAVAAEVALDCDGGYAAFGFDRRAADWSSIQWMYPNQVEAFAFRYHPGATAADDSTLTVTLDLEVRRPLADYLGTADAAGWYDVTVPTAHLNPDGLPFSRFMLFSAAPVGAPRFIVDDLRMVWSDDGRRPVVLGARVEDVEPTGGTVAVWLDEYVEGTLVATPRDGSPPVEVALHPPATVHRAAVQGLPASTEVDVRITVDDRQEVGPSQRRVHHLAFRTADPDVTAPVAANVRVTDIGATRATLCWAADEAAVGVAVLDDGARRVPSAASPLATEACVTVAGLTPATAHTWALTLADRWGNAATVAGPAFSTTRPPRATASVDRATPVAPFPATMRGGNLGNWTFFWGRPYPADAPRLVELLRISRPGVLRHAGGNWSNTVRWDRTDEQCYPRPFYSACERTLYDPPRDGLDRCGPSPTLRPEAYTHAYQPDELAALVELADAVGAEVMIEVNAATCDPDMWADLVRWANLEQGFDIRWWEIGNEFDLNRHLLGLDVPTGADYAARFLDYHAAMTAVDPSIQLVGPAASQLEEDPLFRAESDLLLPLIDEPAVQAPGVLGALSWHVYPHWNGDAPVSASELLDWGPPGSLEGRRNLSPAVAEKRGWLDARGMGDVDIAITELAGVVVGPQTDLNANLAGALWLADALPRLALGGADLAMIWSLIDDPDDNSFGLISPGDASLRLDPVSGLTVLEDTYTPNPAWYTTALLADRFGDTLLASTSSRDDLAVWASTDSNAPGVTWIWVINLSDDAINATVSLDGWIPADIRAWTLEHRAFVEDADKEDVPGAPTLNGRSLDLTSAVTIRASWNAILASGAPMWANRNGLTADWPAYSLTALRLEGP